MLNVIVTGDSRGIGLGMSERLADSGYRVLAVARTRNPSFEESRCSATRLSAVRALRFGRDRCYRGTVQTLRKEYGPRAGLVSNAGISFEGLPAMMPAAKMEHLVRVNTLAPMMLTKYVVRAMMADGGGRIVNISSITALTGYTGLSVYSATKASLIGLALQSLWPAKLVQWA